MRFLVLLLAVVMLVVCGSCNHTEGVATAKKDFLHDNLDTTVSPSQDFFEYANGGWLKRNPIPGDQSSWGIGNLVIEENLKRLREISDNAAKAHATNGTTEQKIGDFWSTAMDSAKIEENGLKPLQPYFDKINAINSVPSLISTVAELKKIGSSTLFSDYVAQDDKNSEVMTYKLWQGGIGLPEREYYFKNDSATINIRHEYVNYITKVLTMAGDDSSKAANSAQNILRLETKLAQASRKLEDLRDPYRNYNKMAIADLPKMSSSIDWTNFLGTSGVAHIDSVVVGQPEF